MTNANTTSTTIIDSDNAPDQWAILIANAYMADGYCPIPVYAESKRPIEKGWPSIPPLPETMDSRFKPGVNFGLVLGKASSGLVDIDLDTAAARALAPHLLPPTEFIFGRISSPRSHYLYKVSDPGHTTQFEAEHMIVEVRSNGCMTVVPPSVHPSGELVEFVPLPEDDYNRFPQPAFDEFKSLVSAASRVAVGAVLLDYWKKGCRHFLSLALAGVLARAGWTEDETSRLVQAVATCAGDEEIGDRLDNIRSTYSRHRSGQAITGWQALSEIVGDGTTAHIKRFVKRDGNISKPSPRCAANSNSSFVLADIGTDDDLAKTFSKEVYQDLRYSESGRQWFKRDGQVFQPVAQSTAQGVMSDFVQMMEMILGSDDKFPRGIKSRSRINGALELSRSRLSVPADDIDTENALVGLSDGKILDLSTAEFVEPERNVFITKKMNVRFDSSASCPRWNEFIQTIFDKNQDVIDFVKRAVGYSMSGEVGEQCMFIMIGTGANGKSTFINALQTLFGDYAGTTPMQTLTISNFSSGQTNDLAMMEGKRFISASDGEAGQRLAEAKIKNMTGGDRIACRALYKDYREFVPQFKLWVATNELPHVTGTDEAIWRRIRVIQFPVTIPEQDRDPRLTQVLADEGSGILNWVLAGYREYRELGGLCPPREVTDATGSYRRENDHIALFIDERCIRQPSATCTSKELYSDFVNWCDEYGHDAGAQPAFGKELGKKGFKPKKLRSGSSWVGITLRSSDDEVRMDAMNKARKIRY